MKITKTFESKFDIGDIVAYDDKILKPEPPKKIIDIKLSSKYEFLYRLEGSAIWITDNHLTKTES